MNVAIRRTMLELAHKIAKTNSPNPEDYGDLCRVLGDMFSEDFRIECKVVITLGEPLDE